MYERNYSSNKRLVSEETLNFLIDHYRSSFHPLSVATSSFSSFFYRCIGISTKLLDFDHSRIPDSSTMVVIVSSEVKEKKEKKFKMSFINEKLKHSRINNFLFIYNHFINKSLQNRKFLVTTLTYSCSIATFIKIFN